MTPEERSRIISEDYVDVFVRYNENMAILEQYRGYTVHIINNRYAVVYYPIDIFMRQSLSRITFAGVPECYGLESWRSLETSGIIQVRETRGFGLMGEGVLIGIADSGIDYTNPIFRNQDGSTRIVSIWDQTIQSDDAYPENTFFGTEYTRDQINTALSSEQPLEIVPSRDTIGHGTMMAGIAAGAERRDENFGGVAPGSELVIVKMKEAKANIRNIWALPQDVPCYQENDLMWAIEYLLSVAAQLGRPIAICIGLGSSLTAHDGRGILSYELSLIGDFPGVVIVVAAGNEGNMRRHFHGIIEPQIGQQTVELFVAPGENDFTMELWGAYPNTYSIDIATPSGEYVPRINSGLFYSREISFIFDPTRISINYIMVEPVSGEQLIVMTFRDPAPGLWIMQVYSRGDTTGDFHIWLPSGRFISPDTYFVQSNPYTTITSPGNSFIPITVTAYNAENSVLYQNASRGYTRNNDVKPELAAPGVNIISPTLEGGFAPVSGTGAAAAHGTGIAAMMLEWGIVRGNYRGMDTVEVKKFLIRGARRNPNLTYPNRDWGYGIVDIYNTFQVLRFYG